MKWNEMSAWSDYQASEGHGFAGCNFILKAVIDLFILGLHNTIHTTLIELH